MLAARGSVLRRGAEALRTTTRRGLAEAAAAGDAKLNLNFFVPHESIKSKAAVDMVIVPASSGLMGVLPNHAPTVAQLRPGVVEIHEGETPEKYFISSGFAFIHKDRTDVCAIEAVKVDDLDPEIVKKGLADSEAAVSSAKDDMERAEAQIGVDVYMAMQGALAN